MANLSSNEPKPQYRQYNPYQNLYTNSKLTKFYNLPTSPEYLFEEEANITRRTWAENLTFYSGGGYLTGAMVGAAKGAVHGLRAAESGESVKIRTNRVLNSGGLTGRRFGNRAGVLGMIYAVLDTNIVEYRGVDDIKGSVLAGLATGALYRVPSGVRSAAVGAVVGGVLVGGVIAGKFVLKKYVNLSI